MVKFGYRLVEFSGIVYKGVVDSEKGIIWK